MPKRRSDNGNPAKRGNMQQISVTVDDKAMEGWNLIIQAVRDKTNMSEDAAAPFARTLFKWYEEALRLGIDPLEFVDRIEATKKRK